jgi:hypothetical protein
MISMLFRRALGIVVTCVAVLGCSNTTVIDRPSPVIDTWAPPTGPPRTASLPASTTPVSTTPAVTTLPANQPTTTLDPLPGVAPGALGPGSTLPPGPPLTFPPGFLEKQPDPKFVEYSADVAQAAMDTVTAKLAVAIEAFVQATTPEEEVAALRPAFFEPEHYAEEFRRKGIKARLKRPVPIPNWTAKRVVAGGDNCLSASVFVDDLIWVNANTDAPAQDLIIGLGRNEFGWVFSGFQLPSPANEKGEACLLVSSKSF